MNCEEDYEIHREKSECIFFNLSFNTRRKQLGKRIFLKAEL